MQTLPDRSIVRKLMVIVEFTNRTTPTNPSDLGAAIAAVRRDEFSFMPPNRRKIEYSKAKAIAPKVRFAIALGLLEEDCTPKIDKREASSEQRAVRLFAERARELLRLKASSLTAILDKAKELLSRNPPILPTSMMLHAECGRELRYTWFRLCLSLLLQETNGALGSSSSRIYIPRSSEPSRRSES